MSNINERMAVFLSKNSTKRFHSEEIAKRFNLLSGSVCARMRRHGWELETENYWVKKGGLKNGNTRRFSYEIYSGPD